MKPASVKFYYVTGQSAYHIFWKQHFNCQLSLNAIEVYFLNLELIVREDRSLVAFRDESPEDIKWLCGNMDESKWQLHDPEFTKEITRIANMLNLSKTE
jgi:hypothetical protein